MAYTPHEWESGEVLTPAKLNTLTTAIGEMDMSYTPKTWHDGDILSAAEMNRIENAVASGGGGGGDFSTATVTVVNNTNGRFVAEIYNIFSAEGFEAMVANAEIGNLDTTIINAVLYKDYCEFYIDGFENTIQTTGDATYEGDGFAVITGDCTITISI